MNMKRILLSLTAWIVFTIVARFTGPASIGWAAAGALTIAVIFLAINAPTGIKIIDLASVTTFAAMTVAGFAGGLSTRLLLTDYGRGGCALVLGLVMAVSAATVPFTEQYARETVPRQLWASPRFRSVNRRVSAVWAAMMLVMAAGHLANGLLTAHTATGASPLGLDLLLNWVVPIAAVYLGFILTKHLVADRRLGADR